MLHEWVWVESTLAVILLLSEICWGQISWLWLVISDSELLWAGVSIASRKASAAESASGRWQLVRPPRQPSLVARLWLSLERNGTLGFRTRQLTNSSCEAIVRQLATCEWQLASDEWQRRDRHAADRQHANDAIACSTRTSLDARLSFSFSFSFLSLLTAASATAPSGRGPNRLVSPAPAAHVAASDAWGRRVRARALDDALDAASRRTRDARARRSPLTDSRCPAAAVLVAAVVRADSCSLESGRRAVRLDGRLLGDGAIRWPRAARCVRAGRRLEAARAVRPVRQELLRPRRSKNPHECGALAADAPLSGGRLRHVVQLTALAVRTALTPLSMLLCFAFYSSRSSSLQPLLL